MAIEDEDSQWRTRAVEDFLRIVYVLQQTNCPVSTTTISQRLHITAPSVIDMIRRLGPRQSSSLHPHGFYPPLPLLEHEPYHGVCLTPAGEQIALQVIRRRRLLELYLVQKLGYAWDEVDEEADRLEHVVSEQFTERLAIALDNPQSDPYGDPIPSVEGTFPLSADEISIVDMAVGQHGVVTRIADYSPDLLHYLGNLGVHPGVDLHVLDRSPLGDTITIQVSSANSSFVLGTLVGDHLRLTRTTEGTAKDTVHSSTSAKAGTS